MGDEPTQVKVALYQRTAPHLSVTPESFQITQSPGERCRSKRILNILNSERETRGSQTTAHLQCCETLLSPAGVVERTVVVAVEWEPSAFDSCEDTGLSVLRAVGGSGEPDGAVVRRGIASACDTPPVPPVASVSGVNSVGGEDVAVMSSLGAAAGKSNSRTEAFSATS